MVRSAAVGDIFLKKAVAAEIGRVLFRGGLVLERFFFDQRGREDGLAQEGRCLLRLGWRYLLGRERRLRRKKSEGG